MVEEMYLEEEKEHQNDVASSEGGGINILGDQKPTQARLVRIDSECMSSIVNNPDDKNDTKSGKTIQNDNQMDAFGSVELDFWSYTHQYSSGHSGGVSLTLGLQQHGESGVSLAFPPAATQSSMFYPRDQIEDCQTVQYSLVDGKGQNMPYRNLMGTHLLHDHLV